ncbi:hypothetical protein RA210_U80032 [Rubrivivax sp. A210]|nr:hypothetical protein RA210_U80032 [Rubrivivax sp. A210]
MRPAGHRRGLPAAGLHAAPRRLLPHRRAAPGLAADCRGGRGLAGRACIRPQADAFLGHRAANPAPYNAGLPEERCNGSHAARLGAFEASRLPPQRRSPTPHVTWVTA